MDDNRASCDPRVSRRKLLLRAGWAIPVIVGMTLPRNAFAQYGGGSSGKKKKGRSGK